MTIIKSFFFVLLVTSVADSQIPVWRKIRPVESTVTDVERLLGITQKRDFFMGFETSEGQYYISFSDGKCVTTWKVEWNAKTAELPPLKEGTKLMDWTLPEWTVEEVSFFPEEEFPLSSLGIDRVKLKKMATLDTLGAYEYTDKKNGIRYEVRALENKDKHRNKKITFVVTGITLFPAEKYKHLICR